MLHVCLDPFELFVASFVDEWVVVLRWMKAVSLLKVVIGV